MRDVYRGGSLVMLVAMTHALQIFAVPTQTCKLRKTKFDISKDGAAVVKNPTVIMVVI